VYGGGVGATGGGKGEEAAAVAVGRGGEMFLRVSVCAARKERRVDERGDSVWSLCRE
jgi:hypothetical protein